MSSAVICDHHTHKIQGPLLRFAVPFDILQISPSPQAIILIKDMLFHFRFLSVLFQDLLRLLSSVALGCHGQGAGRQQTLNDLALLKFDFLKGFWLENRIFSGEQDGKRKINPIPASHIGSIFSSASVNLGSPRDNLLPTDKSPEIKVSGLFSSLSPLVREKSKERGSLF